MDGSASLRIDLRKIRTAHEGRRAAWPRERGPLSVRATVHVIEDHRKEARVGTWVIESGEGPIVGGAGTAPTPLSYVVASLGFAVPTDLVRAFPVFDLPVDDLGLEIDADFPLAASHADEAGGVAAERLRYAVSIRSPGPREQVQAAIAWSERFCHAVHSLREPVPVGATYRLNDEPVAAPA
jgi:uncharacterized OsmC-like protein